MRRAKSLRLWVSFQSRCVGHRQRVFLGGARFRPASHGAPHSGIVISELCGDACVS